MSDSERSEETSDVSERWEALAPISYKEIIEEYHQRGETIKFLREQLNRQREAYNELLEEKKRLVEKLTFPVADIKWTMSSEGNVNE